MARGPGGDSVSALGDANRGCAYLASQAAVSNQRGPAATTPRAAGFLVFTTGVTERNERELSPLMEAIYRGETPEPAGDLDVFEAAALGAVDRLERLLAEDPERVAARSADGFTPLHYAAFFGGPEAVRALAARGADLEAVSTNAELAPGAHPLHSAIAARRLDTCAALVEAGADTSAVYEGRTPAEQAREAGLDWPAEWSSASS